MNLMLHGIQSPRFFYMDTLSKAFAEAGDYDVILMNPPFKGAVDAADVSDKPAGRHAQIGAALRASDVARAGHGAGAAR